MRALNRLALNRNNRAGSQRVNHNCPGEARKNLICRGAITPPWPSPKRSRPGDNVNLSGQARIRAKKAGPRNRGANFGIMQAEGRNVRGIRAQRGNFVIAAGRNARPSRAERDRIGPGRRAFFLPRGTAGCTRVSRRGSRVVACYADFWILVFVKSAGVDFL